jgi:hypothetical protein
MENSLKCRKCGGKHLTIKCNINNNKYNTKLNENENNNSYNTKSNENNNSESNNNRYNSKSNNNRYNTKSNDYNNYKKYYKVKISNLPSDITLEELTNLLENWGNIIKTYVKNFNENSFAIIEFKFKNELDYFIKAINGTPFDNEIITVTELEN